MCQALSLQSSRSCSPKLLRSAIRQRLARTVIFRRCLAEWETQGRIDEFVPGKHDTPDRLLIPEKLYGCAREIDTLLSAFDRVVAGRRPEITTTPRRILCPP